MKAFPAQTSRLAAAMTVAGLFAGFAPGASAEGPAAAPQAAAPQAVAPQSQTQQVQVKGRKVAIGPHCEYYNLATVPLKQVDNQFVIKTTIDGNPATMLTDTGIVHTMFTVDEAKRLGLTLKHSAILTKDAQGNNEATYSTSVKDISLDKFFWHHVDLGVAQNVAESFRELAGADILLNGHNKDVEFSAGTEQLKFLVPSPECRSAFLAYWDDNASSVEMADLAEHDPREVVKVTINGKDLVALIDSGAPTSMIDVNVAERLGITPKSPGVTELSKDYAARKHLGKAWVASFDSFTIGGETINHPRISFADLWGPTEKEPEFRAVLRQAFLGQGQLPPGVIVSQRINRLTTGAQPIERPDMLLGADFLRSHRVLLAMSQHRLYYTYTGGKVFGYTEDAKSADGAQVSTGQ